MRIAVAMIMSLAVATASAAADQAIESKVAGKIEAVDSKVSGTITINFGPAPPAKESDKLKECGAEWNKKLAHYEAARAKTADLGPLTRLDYRNCMYRCLGGRTVMPPECKADLPQ
jgi:hypothetical protein